MTMDADWAKYDTLARFRGTHGSTAFTDFFNSCSIIRSGTGASIATTIADPFGANTGVMTVSSGWLYSTSYQSLSGDFSFGAWLRFSTTDQMYFLCLGGTYTTAFWMVRTSGVITLYSGSKAILTGAYTGSLEWVHINVSRQAGVVKMHINGVSNGTASSALTTDAGGFYLTCRAGYYSYTFLGQMSHFYVCNGNCLYWDDFTPPSAPVVDGAALAFPVGAATVASLFAVAAVGSVEVSGGITTFILPTIDASGIYTRPVLIAPAVSAEGARGVGGSAMITLPVAVQASACRGVRGTADIGVEFNGYAAGGIGPFGQGSALLSPRVAATGGTTRMSFGSASIEIPVNIAACGETTGSVHIQTNSLFVVTRDEVVHVRHG